MAHRGRLNVLANIIGKSPQRDLPRVRGRRSRAATCGRGDVKYHLATARDWIDRRRAARCTCRCASTRATWSSSTRWRWAACAPSRTAHGDAERDARHGAADPRRRRLRRRGHRAGDAQPQRAAPATRTGGTLHVIVNNQIGFTTPPERGPLDAPTPPTWPRCCRSRSSTSTAKIPRPSPRSCDLAMDFRREFQRDVVIDMYCYRRCGHNEGDEPAFTQPLMYAGDRAAQVASARATSSTCSSWASVTREEADEIARAAPRAPGERAVEARAATSHALQPNDARAASGSGYRGGPDERRRGRRHRRARERARASCCEALTRAARRASTPHPQARALARSSAARWRAASSPLDWAAAEALAFATLAARGLSACA